MNVDVAVVADFASMSEHGKLNVMGMFDRIWAPAFPTVHAYMVLALRLRLEFEDRDRTHSIDITLDDEDGRQWGGGSGKIQVGSIPAGHREVLSQIIQFPGIVFPHPGEYSFTLKWNGDVKAKVPLTLALQPQPPVAAPPTDGT